MQNYVTKRLEEGSAELKQAYNDLTAIAKDIQDSNKGTKFYVDPFQIYISATVVSNKSSITKNEVMKGQGKTFAILLAAVKMSKDDSGKPVLMVTATDQLRTQFFKDIQLLKDSSKYLATASLPEDISPFCPVFVDEADLVAYS